MNWMIFWIDKSWIKFHFLNFWILNVGILDSIITRQLTFKIQLPLFRSFKKSRNWTNLSLIRKPRVDQAPESTPRKSQSFSHSTPRTGGGNTPLKESLNENLIKITKMGTVTVPVPYPVISSSNEDLSTQWFWFQPSYRPCQSIELSRGQHNPPPL